MVHHYVEPLLREHVWNWTNLSAFPDKKTEADAGGDGGRQGGAEVTYQVQGPEAQVIGEGFSKGTHLGRGLGTFHDHDLIGQ